VEEHDENRPRDIVLGKLYDALLTAQHFAEMAGLEQMARGLREMRRRTYVATVLGAQSMPNDSPDED
jgi:hypothetical protein